LGRLGVIMDRELRSLTVLARYGMGFVGLAVALFGVIQGGIAAAQYYKPDLGTGLDISNAAAVKDASVHGMAVGAAAALIGALVGLIGLARARNGMRQVAQMEMRQTETTQVPTPALPVVENTIDLTENVTLEPMPTTVGDQLAPFAKRVWQCKLGVDLQNQRLRAQGLGAESHIDAELYVLALRNLVQAVKAAQAKTRSMHVWQAITTFGRAVGDPDRFLARLEQAATGTDSPELVVEFPPSGTVIRLAPFALPVELLTRAAHQLATTTIGDLSGIRARATRSVHVPTR
jgi:hypothetical protein